MNFALPTRVLATAVAVFACCATAIAQPLTTRPVLDPAQLDCPWPKHSHYKQPWRGYLETRSGADFLAGIGVNWASPAPTADALAVRLLAEAGFKTFRIEVGWGSVKWDESGITSEDRVRKLLALCKQHGIRPTMLLNAHQGVPCPVQFFNRRLAEDAAKGARSIKLKDTKGLVAGRSGLNGLTEYWAAEALITAIDDKTGECQLSKPLPKDLSAARDVPMATLRYLPFHKVGTPEFDETADGWVRYALLIGRLVAEAGIDEFDLEIWNELTFGTKFLNAENYVGGGKGGAPGGWLHEGGPCWEVARRTVDAAKAKYPKVRCIWGFSNTTFHATPIAKLPPGIDGQSYHPYGTGTRKLPEKEQHKDQPKNNIEGFTPTIDIRMPEGWAHTFIQTECLIRHINPKSRATARPAKTQRFYHYMTEHGVLPIECEVTTEPAAWDLKSKVVLRSFCLWLGKGMDALHYFNAYQKKPLDFGLLPPDLATLTADAPFEQVATPPLKALRNLTRAFAGSERLTTTTPLAAHYAPLEPPGVIFAGDATHPPLTEADVFAFLPFQLAPERFVIAVYVMTYDITKPLPDRPYRLTIRGLPAKVTAKELRDPLTGKILPVKVVARTADALEVELPVSDVPRLLVVE